MNRTEIKKTLDVLTADIDVITDPKTSLILHTLLNLIEVLADENAVLQSTIQKLNDEINRLKGEQGKPDIRKQSSDHSSEDNRKKHDNKKPRKPKVKKKETVKIDRKIVCNIDLNSLPLDVKFQGHETRVIQDILISTDNIEFSLPIYYSASLKKTFIASLPDGYYGEFGPGIRTLVLTLYRDSGMTQPAIERFLATFSIEISSSTISRMITENHDVFHQEKEDIITAGLQSTPYHHIDDTSCRVNGKNHYTHIVCNPYFAAYFTRPKKDRLTLLDILCRDELKFKINLDAYGLMTDVGLSEKYLNALQSIVYKESMTRQELNDLLLQLFPNPKKHKTNRRIIHEASAITYYRSSEFAIKHLICDDAPQFNKIAQYKSLCWIHEGRHYKKLAAIFATHQKLLSNVIKQFWDYYHALLAYQLTPSAIKAHELSRDFDYLFSRKTGYDALDKRLALTLNKKQSLLLVLEFPFLPLQNNAAELGARVQARMRDINLQTVSENGTKTKDTFTTIVQTARKLGVNIYHYIYDRMSKKFAMTSLADLINEKSSTDLIGLDPI
jgi:hypothetical protein